jgi:hypothetical protein
LYCTAQYTEDALSPYFGYFTSGARVSVWEFLDVIVAVAVTEDEIWLIWAMSSVVGDVNKYVPLLGTHEMTPEVPEERAPHYLDMGVQGGKALKIIVAQIPLTFGFPSKRIKLL